MGLINEAAELYLYSRKLTNINKSIHRYARKAEKHKRNQLASNEKKRVKHRKKHEKVTKEITHLLELHNEHVKELRKHYADFTHELRKEGMR